MWVHGHDGDGLERQASHCQRYATAQLPPALLHVPAQRGEGSPRTAPWRPTGVWRLCGEGLTDGHARVRGKRVQWAIAER